MRIQIDANIKWVVQQQPSGRFVAWCDELGLTVEGDNQADLASVIGEAMHVLFTDLFQEGDLAEFLRDHGWKTNSPLPERATEDGVAFEVPFATEPAQQSACA